VKILLTVDPELPVPPGLYGGIERIVEVLVNKYVAAGHSVTLCANADSKVPCRLVGWPGRHSQNKGDLLRNTLTLTRVVFKERFDVVHSFSRLAYMMPVLPFAIPKIMSYQREPTLSQVSWGIRLSARGTLVFTGCSNYITDKLSSVSEAYTIYNCAPVERYSMTEQPGDDAPLVFLGRIEDIKGTHTAIEVAQRTGRRLIIAGNIPEGKQSYFDSRVKPHLDDRIVYVGPVNDEQKNKLLENALAFLMPVQWNEPFGIVMAEAMACGTPVLGFPYGSVPEVVQDKINGFVCRDTDEMVQRVGDIGAIDRRTVRRIAESRFSSEKISADYLALYEKLIARRNKKI
jgi:glycosyltransferase involved in cell wall biosynthesis